MTLFDVFLIFLFLMAFPILSIFSSPNQIRNLSDNFDLFRNKKTVEEHINNLPRKKDVEDRKKPSFTLKSFSITFVVVLLLLCSPFYFKAFFDALPI